MAVPRSRGQLAAAALAGLLALIGLVFVASSRGGHGSRVAARDEATSSRSSESSTYAVHPSPTSSATVTSVPPTPATDDVTPDTATSTQDEVNSDVAPPTTTAAPTYGPDALLELFYDPADGSQYHVDAVDPDGSGRTTLVSGINSWWVDWAPGHQQFAWSSVRVFEDGRHVTIVNVDGSGTRELVQRPVGGSFRPFMQNAWSPDGSTIAEFCDSPDDWQVRDICGVDVATGDLHDWVREYGLVDPEDRNEWGEAPVFTFGGWSPSGTQVSYILTSEDSRGSRSHLEVLDLQTGTHRTVVDAVSGGLFTADGKSLLYQTSAYGPLFRIPVEGGSPAAVGGVTLTPMSHSPGGEWYVGVSNGQWRLFDLDGQVRELTGVENLLRVSW